MQPLVWAGRVTSDGGGESARGYHRPCQGIPVEHCVYSGSPSLSSQIGHTQAQTCPAGHTHAGQKSEAVSLRFRNLDGLQALLPSCPTTEPTALLPSANLSSEPPCL